MLSKLLKYEYRATAIYFLPIYVMLVLVSAFSYAVRLISKGIAETKGAQSPGLEKLFDTAMTSLGSIYVLLAMALAITTFIVIIMRFYKNLLGNEGYLMFTLPVSVEENILAKLIPAVTWFLGSCLLGILTIAPTFWDGYADFYNFFFNGMELKDFIVALFIIVFAVACLGFGFLFYYLCMCIGQLFNSHKFIASAAVYIGIQGALQVLTVIGIVLFVNFFYSDITFFQNVALFIDGLDYHTFLMLFFGVLDAFVFLCAAGLFWLDCRILKKKLNLT
ncbi:MAG: hypothetical protein ACI4IW_05400 [Oscillospiraceae bacterium]